MRHLRFFLFGVLLLGPVCWAQGGTLPATITVGSTSTQTFIPLNVFGNNTGYSLPASGWTGSQPEVQAAGNYFLRYPGGSASDMYHWNGAGSYDVNNHWVPSGTGFSTGFQDAPLYTGTSGAGGFYSNLTDGNTATTWLSNTDTDFPNHQWVELDLTSSQSINGVTIIWGTPYATQFVVQYWNQTGWPPPYQSSYQNGASTGLTESNWLNATTTLAGNGGTQGITFNTVSAQYIRVLMTFSSAGAGGAYAMREIYLYNGTAQLTANTPNSSNQTTVEVSSTDPACQTAGYYDFDFETFMTYIHSFTPNGVPLITINMGTGTPSEAASWVYYANVTKGYGIKYWEIGNEMGGNWEVGGPLSAQDYAYRFTEYYNAMKTVDSSITIVGPVYGALVDSVAYDGKSYIQSFLDQMKTLGVSGDVMGIDFHWYPNNYPATYYSNAVTLAMALGTPSQWTSVGGDINSWLSADSYSSNTPIFLTEYNIDPGSPPVCEQLATGLWTADWLGEYITEFGSRAYGNFFCAMGYAYTGDETQSVTVGDLAYLQADSNAYQYQGRATYWAMQMMTNDWASSGDTNTHTLLTTTVAANGGPTSLLTAYTDKRPDNIVSLMVVNKDPSNSYATTVNMGAFVPNASANEWTFNSANYVWESTSVPYHAIPDTAPTAVTLTNAASSFPVTFQPYSISVIQFTNAGQSTNTPTFSPTITPSPTFTSTPNYGPATLIDDFENLTRDGIPPARINLWDGTWGTGEYNSSITVQYGVPGKVGNYAVKVSGVLGGSGSNGWVDYESGLSNTFPLASYNVAAYGAVGLQFWIYGDGNTYRVDVDSQSVTDYDPYGFGITPPAGVWTFEQIPFSTMTRGWTGSQTGLPTNPTATDLTGVEFFCYGAASPGNISYQLDQIAFYTDLELTPSATPTSTLATTATMTSTNTATSTATNTVTETATNTSSNTVTNSTTSTASNTTTNSPTLTPTQTPTNTATVTGTLPPTDTYTDTPTNTSSSTATNTSTTTATSTATNSPTITATNSATNTVTNTATVTSTSTETNTFTVTSTNTVTNTVTNTYSQTSTPTITQTYTATNTPTMTSTNTPTSSPSSTFTYQPTMTATSTPTFTSTYTATVSSVIAISQPFPNPSIGSPITFNVNVPSQSKVTVDVFTTAFRKIRSLTAKVYGSQTFQWDLIDFKGNQAADGLYYVRVQVNGTKSSSKILKVMILR
jgi:hypothetical protein